MNILGALSLIRYCLKPDANSRATTKDMLHHNWLINGPVLSLQLNLSALSCLSLNDRQLSNGYDGNRRLRTTTTTESLTAPTNSLVELELHTSSFFDATRLRNNSLLNKKEQQRHRISAIPISTRYLSLNNTKTDSTSLSRPTCRRPVSLSFDDQCLSNETTQIRSVNNQCSRQTVSPSSTTIKAYDNNNQFSSSQTTCQSTFPAASETTTTITTAPLHYVVSYDSDSTVNNLKLKEACKHSSLSTKELDMMPHVLNSTTTVGPTVFTTSTIRFAPAPTRRINSFRNQENSSSASAARLLNNTISNQSSRINDSINIISTNNNDNRCSLLTTLELPTSYNTHNKNSFLDNNNNLVPLKVYEQ